MINVGVQHDLIALLLQCIVSKPFTCMINSHVCHNIQA